MKNGICPKCEAKEIHVYTNMDGETAIAITNMWKWKKASIDYHICTNCGYVELFVQDKSLLPEIAEKYPKVKSY